MSLPAWVVDETPVNDLSKAELNQKALMLIATYFQNLWD
ncbi:MAG: hypothetical protein GAK29_02012 [Acinetobacter bereziniae]|uniref:Uncharacterized protein n=1 Tax=Acinetobacter bereziniae TaxID=106648 RepID=A0A833PGQ9_ACIBZ|nr:MAG: hypothetical protein GAK29_02012 [Acinetobacter bereziniae]